MWLLRIIGAWVVLAAAMSANGAFRELVLKRAIGNPAAGAASATLGIAIIVTLTWLLLPPLRGLSIPTLFAVSALLVALTVAFEFSVGHYLGHKSWQTLAGNYAIWRGQLWPLVLLSLALTPFLWGRWAGEGRRAASVAASVSTGSFPAFVTAQLIATDTVDLCRPSPSPERSVPRSSAASSLISPGHRST